MSTTMSDVKVKDVMREKVITLPVTATVEEAIETFEDDHVSGIPIVDSGGKLVGVLSVHDVARRDHVRQGRFESSKSEYQFASPLEEEMGEGSADDEEFTGKEDYSPEMIGREMVKDWMNPSVISLGPDASLKQACDLMVKESIHRVLIVDDRQHLLGLLTTFDVVAWVSRSL
jgi:CBS domain-containing protein